MKRGSIYLALLVVILVGCDRQIPILQDQNIIGYQIQGKVTDRLGNPIPNVTVFVDYSWDTVQNDSVMTRQYFVTDPTADVQAVVTNWNNNTIMVLTPPQKVNGWFVAVWDGKDSTGGVPPSGLYSVRYLVNGRPAFSYKQLVSGGPVTKTDLYGGYTIPLQNLPVDSTFPYFSTRDSSYFGSFTINNDVILTFSFPPHQIYVEKLLYRDLVTIVDVTF